LLALALAGWMLFKFYSDRGVDIVITFKDGSGLLERKTLLKYKGIVVGHVTKIKLNESDISKVDVTVSVNSNAIKAVAREGNEFWKVKPKVTLTEVSGLETIVGGLYIEIFPAKRTIRELVELPEKYIFKSSQHKPFDQINPGLVLKLHDSEGRFALDTPIVYKKFIVGSVVERKLLKDGVDYIVHIKEKYKHLIRKNSCFWGLNSIDFKASMAGVKLKVDSLATLIAGGITFNSPDSNSSISLSNRDNIIEFNLYKDKDDIYYDQDSITLMASKAYNMDVDLSLIYYKGVVAGKMSSIEYDPIAQKSKITIKLKKIFTDLLKERAYFWIVEPKLGLGEISGLDAIARGPYITFLPNIGSKNSNNSFLLHDKAPKKGGKKVSLFAENVGSLHEGSSIFYNDIDVGYIGEINLSKDKKSLKIDAIIDNEHYSLLNDSSVFYLRKAVVADISFSKIRIKAGSVKSILQGGIAFDTDDFKAPKTKKIFKLHPDILDVEHSRYLNNGGIYLNLHVKESASLKEGSAIYYNRFKAGEIISLDYNSSTDMVDLKIYIEKKFADKINDSTRFYNASGLNVEMDLSSVKIDMQSVESVVSGAIAFLTLEKDAKKSSSKEYILYNNYTDAKDDSYKATLILDKARNLHVGSSIIYKGVTIGKVSDLSIVDNHVELIMSIDKEYKKYMREDALISLAKFKFGLDGIKNAKSAIFGPSLHVSPGKSEKLGSVYHLGDIITHKNQLREGLRVVVSADRRGSLKVGSPLTYRQIKIGDIEEYRLSDNATQVELLVYIEPCYAYLIRENSIFYNATALGMEVGLSGVKVKTETLETMISGGIVVVTPTKPKEQAKEMKVFKLHNEAEDEWINWHPRLSSEDPMCQ
jgi:paraquat-inducible protein B